MVLAAILAAILKNCFPKVDFLGFLEIEIKLNFFKLNSVAMLQTKESMTYNEQHIRKIGQSFTPFWCEKYPTCGQLIQNLNHDWSNLSKDIG